MMLCIERKLPDRKGIRYNHEAHEVHEGFGDYHIPISYFVLFAIFVVKYLSKQGVNERVYCDDGSFCVHH
jgi:hypothetical protein